MKCDGKTLGVQIWLVAICLACKEALAQKECSVQASVSTVSQDRENSYAIQQIHAPVVDMLSDLDRGTAESQSRRAKMFALPIRPMDGPETKSVSRSPGTNNNNTTEAPSAYRSTGRRSFAELAGTQKECVVREERVVERTIH
jgi:hypothetical protein